MKIGILLPGHVTKSLVAEHGDYDDMFRALLDGQGFSFESWDVEGGVLPEDPGEADGWLITGSRHGVYEDHDWIAPLEAFIRACFEQSVPMIGVCFGHQIIAQALGGRVEKYKGGWGLGSLDYENKNSDNSDRIVAIHQDQVIDPPAQAKTLASSDLCRHAMLSYGKQALTIQPHPEFNEHFLADMVEARYRQVQDAPADAALETIGRGDLTSARFSEVFADFFRQSAKAV